MTTQQHTDPMMRELTTQAICPCKASATPAQDGGAVSPIDASDNKSERAINANHKSTISLGEEEPAGELVLELLTEEGLPIPDARFVVRFENGMERAGKLTRDGRCTLYGTPEGEPYIVDYQDHVDVRQKAYMMRCYEAISSGDIATLEGAITISRTDLCGVAQKYADYFGDDLPNAISAAFADNDRFPLVHYLMNLGGLVNDATLLDEDGNEV